MDLFSADELITYAQRNIPPETAALIKALVEDKILGLPGIGPRITDPPQRGVKGIALEVARRAASNPSNAASESTNGTSVTWFPGSNRGVDLTDREVGQLRDLVGDSTAYSVTVLDEGLGQRVWAGAATPPQSWGWR